MYLVTGGAGFIGSHIVKQLVDLGQRVRVVDNLSSGSLGNLQELLEQIEFVQVDIREKSLHHVFKDVRFILHQAAVASVERSIKDPVETELNNVAGTVNVLQQAKAAGVKRVVLASTAAVYGNGGTVPLSEDFPADPLSPYAASKYACEIYARCFSSLFGMETVVLRYFNVFGPNQDPASDYSGVISRFVDRMIRRLPPLVFGDGLQTRDFIYVQNVAAANILASVSTRVGRGEVINIAGGDSITINRLAGELNTMLGTNLDPEYREARPGEVRYSLADITRARELLGYEIKVDFSEGLRRLVKWWKSQSMIEPVR